MPHISKTALKKMLAIIFLISAAIMGNYIVADGSTGSCSPNCGGTQPR